MSVDKRSENEIYVDCDEKTSNECKIRVGRFSSWDAMMKALDDYGWVKGKPGSNYNCCDACKKVTTK